MKPSLKPGIRYEHRFVVPSSKTVPALYPEADEFLLMPEVFATGFLVGFLEWACIRAINPHLDWPREQTLGTHIDVSHRAATPPGMEVIANVELVSVEGKKLVFNVAAHDGVEVISQGQHERHVVDKDRFDAKVLAKKRSAPAGTSRSHAMFSIVEYSDELAGAFRDINAQWIDAMYKMEDVDRDVLDHPRERIIEPGGVILFVHARGLGIVGTCALRKTGPAAYELTKMGVLEAARGLKAGEFLLAAVIDRAKSLGAQTLYLLSNQRSAAAIHLYEKLGFVHDAGIMKVHGAHYERCNVAMRYAPAKAGSLP